MFFSKLLDAAFRESYDMEGWEKTVLMQEAERALHGTADGFTNKPRVSAAILAAVTGGCPAWRLGRCTCSAHWMSWDQSLQESEVLHDRP